MAGELAGMDGCLKYQVLKGHTCAERGVLLPWEARSHVIALIQHRSLWLMQPKGAFVFCGGWQSWMREQIQLCATLPHEANLDAGIDSKEGIFGAGSEDEQCHHMSVEREALGA